MMEQELLCHKDRFLTNLDPYIHFYETTSRDRADGMCMLEGFESKEILHLQQVHGGKLNCGRSYVLENNVESMKNLPEHGLIIYQDQEQVGFVQPTSKKTDWANFPLVRCAKYKVEFDYPLQPLVQDEDEVERMLRYNSLFTAAEELAFEIFKFAHETSRLEEGLSTGNWGILATKTWNPLPNIVNFYDQTVRRNRVAVQVTAVVELN